MPHAQQKTILVIEDHPLNMKLVVDLLELHGYRVLQASDAESALQLVSHTIPDLALLDIHLPGMDGFELFGRLRAIASLAQMKLVALTASAMREEEQQIRAMGFDAYIAKPINVKQFPEQIRALLTG